ncbi:MAG TPA: DNA gyrase modulator, partial [Steroidobacteraceae bacterium]|nr:DNA gyrase modulator [Steroidobacteraceae bacterium]
MSGIPAGAAPATAAACDPLQLARELILHPGGLDDQRLDRVFGEVLSHSVDFADLYFQLCHQESWSLEDGIVKDGSASIEQGVGVRALAGERTGFAYSDEIVLPALEEASHAARAIAVHGGERRVSAWRAQPGHRLYLPVDPAAALATADKVAWLERVDREARRLDPRVVHVTASLVAVHEVVLIATSEG